MLISGDTGCGKTTQVPQYILEEFDLTDGIIGVTQPRRIAAVTLCQRVSSELGTDVGYTCGYEIRFESALNEYTKIKFMTDGVLLREMSLDPLLLRYKFLVIDEAHERGLNSDILLGLIKWTLPRREDLKIVVMSATLETAKIFNFFERGRVDNY